MSKRIKGPNREEKRKAAALIREINRLDRLMAKNQAVAERRAARAVAVENRPHQQTRDRYAASLRQLGEQWLPPDSSDGAIDLGAGRKLYRERSEAVEFDSGAANKVVAALKARPFWRRVFLTRKVTYSVSKEGVKKRPYIARKVAGLRIVQRNGLYVQKGVKGGKPETLALDETD